MNDRAMGNKDSVISRLSAQYEAQRDALSHSEQRHEQELLSLHTKLEDMAESHKFQVARLKDEYMSRIRRHRTQMQEYLNSTLQHHRNVSSNNKKRESLNNAQHPQRGPQEEDVEMDSDHHDNEEVEDMDIDPAIATNSNNNSHSNEEMEELHNLHSHFHPMSMSMSMAMGMTTGHEHEYNESERSLSCQSFASHSREGSSMSAISQSADEIVTALVIGIDDELDDILTPVVSYKDPYDNYAIFDGQKSTKSSPKDAMSSHRHQTTITPFQMNQASNYNHVDFNDLTESPPEPSDVTVSENIIGPSTGTTLYSTMSAMSHSPVDGPRSNVSLLLSKPMMAMITKDPQHPQPHPHGNNSDEMKEMAVMSHNILEYEARTLEYETEIKELRESLDEMVRKHEEQEMEISTLKEKNRKYKRREFDWTAKEREHKSLLSQYRELRENNAKLTLTYFTLQCQYDKLKRDYDEKASMILNYGDYQINLTNQIMAHQMINDTSSTNSSVRNVLPVLSNNNSNSNEQMFQFTINSLASPPHPDQGDFHMHMNNEHGLNMLTASDDEDEVDMVVGFMSSTDQRSTQVMNLNDIALSDTNRSNMSLLSAHQSTMSITSHGYNTSYFGNNLAFQYTAKSKDELIEEVMKLREKLDEMTDKKFLILKNTTQEIDRLNSKIRLLEDGSTTSVQEMAGMELQIDHALDTKNESAHKQRASFGGGIVTNIEDHTYTVSRNNHDLDSIAKQLNKQHSRAQSMANSKYLLLPNAATNHSKSKSSNHSNSDSKFIDEDHSDDGGLESVGKAEDGHHKSLTFLQNIAETVDEDD